MFESARLVDTEPAPRELADSELPPRAPAEFELTPGVRLEPRELPAFSPEDDPRLAPFTPLAPPRTELLAFDPPPERPK
jgi:hypothetical protein